MTNKIRRTEIKIETHEVKIIRFGSRRLSVYCEQCRVTVRAFTLNETAAFFRINLTDVCRFIGAEKFHLVSANRRLPLVCSNSLGSENNMPVPRASAETNNKKE